MRRFIAVAAVMVVALVILMSVTLAIARAYPDPQEAAIAEALRPGNCPVDPATQKPFACWHGIMISYMDGTPRQEAEAILKHDPEITDVHHERSCCCILVWSFKSLPGWIGCTGDADHVGWINIYPPGFQLSNHWLGRILAIYGKPKNVNLCKNGDRDWDMFLEYENTIISFTTFPRTDPYVNDEMSLQSIDFGQPTTDFWSKWHGYKIWHLYGKNYFDQCIVEGN